MDCGNVRLEKAISVAIYRRNSVIIIDADVVWLYSYHSAILLVCLVNEEISLPPPRGPKEPEVREAAC